MSKKRGNYMVFRRPRTRAIRALNNIYVVNRLTVNALTEVRARFHAETDPKIDFEIPVVSGERIVVPRRKTKIIELLDDATTRDLHGQSLISAVAITEDYLIRALTIILRWFPYKLKIAASGAQGDHKVSVDAILEATDLDQLISGIIERRLTTVFYISPQQYFGYIEQVLAFELPEDIKTDYAEVKATRDVLVHNSGVANSLYIRKAGAKARVPEEELVPLDDQYFSESIRCMKRTVARVYSGCLDKYGDVDVGT